jgi:hypothetical protein
MLEILDRAHRVPIGTEMMIIAVKKMSFLFQQAMAILRANVGF